MQSLGGQGIEIGDIFLSSMSPNYKKYKKENKLDVDLIAYELKELQRNHGLSEQTAIEILKMRQLSDDLDSIRDVLRDIHNTI